MKKILFFDGYCSLCNNSVDFLMKRDHQRQIQFASLQGETAEKILPQQNRLDLDTAIYFRDGKIFDRSSAVIYVASDLGGSWKLIKIFLLVPKFIRDIVYRCVASNRYRLMPKRDSCRLPNADEKERLLP